MLNRLISGDDPEGESMRQRNYRERAKIEIPGLNSSDLRIIKTGIKVKGTKILRIYKD